MECLLLTLQELADRIAQGWVMVGGGYPDEPTCLNSCGSSSSSESSIESSSSSSDTPCGCNLPNVVYANKGAITDCAGGPATCDCTTIPDTITLTWNQHDEAWEGSFSSAGAPCASIDPVLVTLDCEGNLSFFCSASATNPATPPDPGDGSGSTPCNGGFPLSYTQQLGSLGPGSTGMYFPACCNGATVGMCIAWTVTE